MPGTLNVGGHDIITHSGDAGAGDVTVNVQNRLVLDSSGLFGIGTSSPQYKLHIRGTDATSIFVVGSTSENTALEVLTYQDDRVVLRSNDNGNGRVLAFETGTTERMRIDSSGNVAVGTVSLVDGGERFCVVNPSNTGTWNSVFSNPGSSPFGILIKYSAASPIGTGNRFIDCVDSTALRFQIRSNGGIANYSANDTNLSDRREKTNFAPAKNYLETICSIPVQTFNYIDQNLEEDDGLTLGVIAQDVQEVAPELVMESNWGTKEEPKMRLSIYQTDLQYALMKSIQEQQSIIEALTARIEALENA